MEGAYVVHVAHTLLLFVAIPDPPISFRNILFSLAPILGGGHETLGEILAAVQPKP